jgi:uncharacterized membrane protein YeaQ/YmgE (transglycosylase-associated protein family)
MQSRKKARILVATTLFLTLIGGAIASDVTANRRGKLIFCATTSGVIGSSKINYTITTLPSAISSFCTIDPSGFCLLVRILIAI